MRLQFYAGETNILADVSAAVSHMLDDRPQPRRYRLRRKNVSRDPSEAEL